jgi:hypothetical protein
LKNIALTPGQHLHEDLSTGQHLMIAEEYATAEARIRGSGYLLFRARCPKSEGIALAS